MVSKGWRRDLAHSDASADARLFLRPSMASEDFLDGDDDDESPPPREITAVDGTADGRRRRRRLILLLADDATTSKGWPFLAASTFVACVCGAATGRMCRSDSEAATLLLLLLSRHAMRQSRTVLRFVGLIMGNVTVCDAALPVLEYREPNGTKNEPNARPARCHISEVHMRVLFIWRPHRLLIFCREVKLKSGYRILFANALLL